MNDDKPFAWCIIGNIIEEHYWGENKEIRKGSKQFRPGAKVYCIPAFSGDGHDNMRVIGKPRRYDGLIDVVIRTNLIKNFRVKKVYNPKVISIITNSNFYRKYHNLENFQAELEEIATTLNEIVLTSNNLNK